MTENITEKAQMKVSRTRVQESCPQQQQKRVWDMIVNSMQTLLHCKVYDTFDFKSVVLLTQFVFGLSKAATHTPSSSSSSLSLAWAVPSAATTRQLQTLGIELTASWCSQLMQARLLDKKRTQIVGIWVQESSALPFEQVSRQ
jgi:hypothetical protein